MSNEPSVYWSGTSGKKYGYWVYKLPPNFAHKPGNYIFAKVNSAGKWEPLYIGQTKELDERFDNHHKMQKIKLHGATHIHAHTNSAGEQERLNEESSVVAARDARSFCSEVRVIECGLL